MGMLLLATIMMPFSARCLLSEPVLHFTTCMSANRCFFGHDIPFQLANHASGHELIAIVHNSPSSPLPVIHVPVIYQYCSPEYMVSRCQYGGAMKDANWNMGPAALQPPATACCDPNEAAPASCRPADLYDLNAVDALSYGTCEGVRRLRTPWCSARCVMPFIKVLVWAYQTLAALLRTPLHLRGSNGVQDSTCHSARSPQ